MRTVVVTGIGVVCATASNTTDFRAALCEGTSGIGHLSCYEDSSWFNTRVGAEVRDFSFDRYVPPAEQRRIDRQILLAIAAADEAVGDVGLTLGELGDRVGVVLGTGMGPSVTTESALSDVTLNHTKPRPTTIPTCMYNSAAANLSIRYGCRGPSLVVTTACAASAHALSVAADYIRLGKADLCLAGGAEAFPSYAMMAAWDSLGVMSKENEDPPRACRPFSLDRQGFVMGEGASILVLEDAEKARKRGARIYGELAGVGLSSDALHITRPSMSGIEAALGDALDSARIDPSEVGYINAHGTATIANDVIETRAIHRVFGEHAQRIPISSTKSSHGHTIGAAGAVEAAATLLGLYYGFVPPTLHLDVPDPECDLDYVPHEARESRFDVALSNSFAFGGHNVTLVFRRF